MEIPIPKLVVKVETEQQTELFTMVIPADMVGRFLAFVGQQLDALVVHTTTANTRRAPTAHGPSPVGGSEI